MVLSSYFELSEFGTIESPVYLLLLLFQFPITALREIKILQLLNNENVVNLIEICRTKGTVITTCCGC